MRTLTFDELREIYIQDISKPVPRNFKYVPRARHPKKYEDIQRPENQVLIDDSTIDRTWVWSDLHLGHTNIIKYCDRPFPNTYKMDQTLINNHNSCVGYDDISICVGDVAFLRDERANGYLDQMNGYKILIVGNHDFKGKQLKKLHFDEIHLIYVIEHPDVDLVFTHYPIEQGLPKPYINVHGHVHVGKWEYNTPQHINVNCEFHEFKPIPLKTIVEWATSKVKSFDK